MVTLDKIRKDMEAQFEIDSNIQCVIVNADTIEDALADAAVQLDSKVSHLEYEVIEKGSNGFLGLAKKPWKLSIYQTLEGLSKKKKRNLDIDFGDDQSNEEVVSVDQDGIYYIRHFGDSICLKVIPPVGNGKPVDVKNILSDAKRTDTISVDEDKVKKLVKKGTDQKYEEIGKYKRNNHKPNL